MFCFLSFFDNENCTVCTSTHDSEKKPRVADELLIKRLFFLLSRKPSRGPPAATLIFKAESTWYTLCFYMVPNFSVY